MAAMPAPHKKNTCSSASYGNGVLLLALRKGQNMYFNQVEFGQRIKELRNQKRWTQERLADELNIGVVHLYNIECGRKGCSLDLLLELSELFDVSTDYLLTGKVQSHADIRGRLQSVIGELGVILAEINENPA